MKTLVCLLGQTRAATHAFPTLVKHVLDPLQADLLVCHIENQYGRETAFHQRAKYQLVLKPYQDYGDYLDMLGGTHWHILKELKGNWLGGVKGPFWFHGAMIQYMRYELLTWLRATRMMGYYDWFIVTRPDYYYFCHHPPIELLDSGGFWVTNGVQWRGLKDHYACLHKTFVSSYLNLADTVVSYSDTLKELIPATDQYQEEGYLSIERFQKLHLMIRGVWDDINYFPQFGCIIRDPSDPVGSSPGIPHPQGFLVKFGFEMEAAQKTANQVASLGWESLIS